MPMAQKEKGLDNKERPCGGASGSSSGRPKVFESKKEKKRRLILSDSESDDYMVSPRPKVVPGADHNGNSLATGETKGEERIKCESGTKYEGKGIKLREDTGVDMKKVAESGLDRKSSREAYDVEVRVSPRPKVVSGSDHNGNSIATGERKDEERIKCEFGSKDEEKRIKQREDTGVDMKKVAESGLERKRSREASDVEVRVSPHPKVVSGADHNGNSLATGEGKGEERIKCEIGTKDEGKRIKLRENTGVDMKKVAESGLERKRSRKTSDVEARVSLRPKVVPRADHNGNSLATGERKGEEGIKCEVGTKDEGKRIKRREDTDVDMKKVTESGLERKRSREASDVEVTVSLHPKVVPGADHNSNSLATGERKGEERIKSEGGTKDEGKRIKRREDTDVDIKKVAESGLERKRSSEASDVEVALKKKTPESLKRGRDQTGEIGGKKLKVNWERGDERAEVRANRVLGSQKVVPAGRQRDGQNKERMHFKLNKTSMLKAEKIRWEDRSGQKTLRMLKDNSNRPVGVKREEFGISHHKSIRVQGKGGVLKVLPKKVGVLEKAHIQRDAEENGRTLGSPSIANRSILKHPSLSEERNVFEKPSKALRLGKNQLQMERISSAEKNRSSEAKTKPELSPEIKSKNADSSCRKNGALVKRERSSSSKTPVLNKQNTESGRLGRSTEKQKVREQIKAMLLNAGWKIELRPRRNRDYEDSVYVSPQGTGYWSITKAYAVFQDQFNGARDDKGKDLYSSKTSRRNLGGKSPPFSAIPMEVLSLLKRNVVNKRSKKMLGDTQKKLGGATRGRKVKEVTNVKRANTKGFVGSTVRKHQFLRVRNNKSKRGCALLVRGSNQDEETDYDDYVPYMWKRTVLSWMIDLGVVLANGKVKYMNKEHTETLLEGWATRDGIHCSCCSKILTVSKFEIHAGSKLCQPYQNIYVEDAGISLLQCQLNAWKKQDESERRGFYSMAVDGDDPNDDTCLICGDGGDLICCDGCPSTFHLSCLGIQMLPRGDWHCSNCSCRFCGVVSGDAAEGHGVTVTPLLSCSLCEEKYHQKCVPEADSIPVDSNSSRTSFCGQRCKKLFKRLQKLLGVKNDLEAGFSWTVIRRFDEDSTTSLPGLARRAECNSKIAVALAVVDECFLPIIDKRSGINLIRNVLYNCGSNFNRLDYSGFYTFILERGDEVICAASIRIHGTRLAEMPFIGTRNMYRRQGMCRRLLNGIESALCSLNVEKLVIPAISELTDTWTTVFGFKPLEASQKEEIKSISMLVFPGIGLLQKPLLKNDSTEDYTAAGVEKVKSEAAHHLTPGLTNKSSGSSVGPNLHDSDEVIVCHKHEVNDVERNFSPFGGSMSCTAEVLPESSDVHGSDFQASQHESSGTVAEADLSLHHDAVYHNEPPLSNKLLVGSSIEPKIELPCEGTTVEDTIVQHPSEAKCISPDDTASTLPDYGQRTVPSLLAADGTLLQHTFESQCTSPDAIASTLRASDGNTLHIPVCSLESSSDATNHNRSEVTSKSSTDSPVEHILQASSELIVDKIHDIKDKVTTPKACDENSGHCGSEIIAEPQDVVTNKLHASSVTPNIHVGSEGIVHVIHDAKAEVASFGPKACAVVGDKGQHTPRIINRSVDAAPGKEIQSSCSSSMSHDSVIDTRPVCVVSGQSFQVSNKSSIQHDTEVLQKTPEFPDIAPSFATEAAVQYNKPNLVNSLDVSSLCDPNISSKGVNSSQYYTPDMFGESVDDAPESMVISSCGIKTSEVPGESPSSSDVAYPLKPDAGSHNLPLVAKDSAVSVPCVSDRYASIEGTLLNTQN